MIIGTCKDCKHWRRTGTIFRTCTGVKAMPDSRKLEEKELVYTSDWRAGLLTHKDFGCVKFETE